MDLVGDARTASEPCRARARRSGRSRGAAFERLERRVLLAGVDFGSATPLPAPDQLLTLAPGSQDFYAFTAGADGYVTVVERPSSSLRGLDASLSVYDAARSLVGTSDDFAQPDGRTVSEVTFFANADETYYVVAGGFEGASGRYEVSVAPDFPGYSFDTAQSVTLTPSGTNAVPIDDAIAFPGEVNYYRFQADSTGLMTVSQVWQQPAGVPVANGLDSFLSVYDASRNLITFDDDSASPNPLDSVARFPVVAGDFYYLAAAAFSNPGGNNATGPYQLQLSTAAGAGLGPGHSFDDPSVVSLAETSAGPLPLGASAVGGGFARLPGRIDTLGGVNVYRFTAPAAESVDVQLEPAAANGFEGFLYVFDAANRLVTSDYNDRLLQDSPDSSVQFNTVPGQTYFVQVAGFRGTTGDYDLTFTTGFTLPDPSDGLGRSFAAATPVNFDDTAPVTVIGTIETPGDANVFELQPGGFGVEAVTIREVAAPGSLLDPFLYVFTDSQTLLPVNGSNDDSDVLLGADGRPTEVLDRDSKLTLNLVAGKTYYVKAAAFGSTTGDYFLSVSPAGVPNRDASGDPVGDAIGDVLDRATATPQPVAVATIVLAPDGAGSQSGTIVAPGDDDAFQFTAPVSGLMTVREQAAPGSSLDSDLFAFGPDRLPLASDNDSGGTYDSLVQFDVVAHQTYYVKAAGYGTSTGAYVVTLSTGPAVVGHTFATAMGLDVTPPIVPVGPFAPGGGAVTVAPAVTSVTGVIAAPGDLDFYEFTAPFSGPVTVRQTATGGSGLDSLLYAFDSAQDPLAFDDDADATTLDSQVTFDVTFGQTYFLRAAGFDTSTGTYALTITPGGDPQPDAQTTAQPIALDTKTLTGNAFGDIAFAGDSRLYRFVAPITGPVIVTQEALAGSTLDSFLFVYDASYRVIGSGDDTTVDPNDPRTVADSTVRVSLVAGQTYYLRASGSDRHPDDPGRTPTGAYRVRFTFVPDDFGDTLDDARTLAAPSAGHATIQAAVIDQAGDTDMFQVLATATGRLDLQMAPAPSAPPLLGSALTVFDAAGNEIAHDFNSDAGTPVSDLLLDVHAGTLYFVQAAGYGGATGPYTLTLRTVPPGSFGADFASATPLDVSGPGASETDGLIDADNPVDVFQFNASVSGDLTVNIAAGSGEALVVTAYTYLNGVPTQVGSSTVAAGAPTGTFVFVVASGHTYFLFTRPAPASAFGPYHLTLTTAPPAAPLPDLSRAGKATYSALTDSFTAVVPFGANGSLDSRLQADAITDSLVRAFVASQQRNGGIATDYFLLWTDPIDHIVFDSKNLQSGYTAGLGTLNERGPGYVSGAGALQVEITPASLFTRGELLAHYELELLGLGEGPVLFGASLILAGGKAVEPLVESASEETTAQLPVNVELGGQVAFVLDFPGSAAGDAPEPEESAPVMAAIVATTNLVVVTAAARAGAAATATVIANPAAVDAAAPADAKDTSAAVTTSPGNSAPHASTTAHPSSVQVPPTLGPDVPFIDALKGFAARVAQLNLDQVVGGLWQGLQPLFSAVRSVLSPSAKPAAARPADGAKPADAPSETIPRTESEPPGDSQAAAGRQAAGPPATATPLPTGPTAEPSANASLVVLGIAALPRVIFDGARSGRSARSRPGRTGPPGARPRSI